MVNAATENEMWLAMMDALVGKKADLEPAKAAFERTRGDFATRFTAAVEALFARLMKPEVFIDIPEHPEQLTKAELDTLVRPAAYGFLRSYPNKDELLTQVHLIKRRQDRRPAWLPRVDRNGTPLASADTANPVALRPLAVASFPELGEVTVHLPTDSDDRPELTMAPGGIGELETVLYTVLSVGDEQPRGDLRIDELANEALVPEASRWWSREPVQPVPAAQDPGVASELLATSTTLGGTVIDDNTPAATESMAIALASAGDWRHSRHWLLDAWDPGEDTGILATARAAIAGWADEGSSGLIVYVYGGALHGHEGLFAAPGLLHSYLLCITRSGTGQDTVDSVRRLSLSCPGELWCHRGGCPDCDWLDIAPLLVPVMTTGLAADAATGDLEWARDTYLRLYGTGESEYADTVLDTLEAMLSSAGWVELERSIWEGGQEEILLRRGPHCLNAAYDPVTRQLRLIDGRPFLEGTLDLLADEGVLADDDGQVSVDTGEEAVQRWGSDLLSAAQDLLNGHLQELPLPDGPIQAALLGLHPHGDGSLPSSASIVLAQEQLGTLLYTIGVLHESTVRGEGG